jgi:hypothetical protein
LPLHGKKPGYPLQFLKKPSAFLRDFRFYPLRGTGALETADAVNYKTRTPAGRPKGPPDPP